MVSLQQLKQWLENPLENENLEFKEARNQFKKKKLIEYCVAIANEGGGHIVLGVSDTPPRRVVGTTAFLGPAQTAAQIHAILHFRVTLTELKYADKRVLIVTIPSRPKGQPVHYEGRYLMRAGDSLVPMSPDRLQAIFAEGTPKFEERIAVSGVSAQEVVQLLDTQSYFDLTSLPYPAHRDSVLERFKRENLINEVNNEYSITNLGALLFAKNLDEFENLSRKAVRVTVYGGVDKLITKRDLIESKGYAVGFEGLVGYIDGQLPSSQLIKEALRRTIPVFPKIAIRELVANSLIHQDFEMQGNNISVDIYDNRLEISNPGLPCIKPDRFIDDCQSRNEKLADLMRRLGICEEKGSGFDKVITHIEAYQLPPPDIRTGQVRTTVILFAPKGLNEMDRGDKLRACYQHCVLNYITGRMTTNRTLRKRFGLNARQSSVVSRLIGDAIDEELIKLADPTNPSRRYAHYVPYWA